MSSDTQNARAGDPVLAPTAAAEPRRNGTPLPPASPLPDGRPPLTREGPFELRTLGDLGQMLPVGTPVDGGRVRPFRLRNFTVKQERDLGNLRAKAKGMNHGELVALVMAEMIHTVGPVSFDTLKPSERRLHIASMAMADVLYMYLYLRRVALGDEPIPFQLECPRCSAKFNWGADLASMDVRCVPDDVTSLRREYRMRDGFPVDGQNRDKLYLEPLLWGAFEHRDTNVGNQAERELAVVRQSIVGIDGVNRMVVLQNADLDEMSKYDLEGITRDIEDNSPGPQMVVEVGCQGPFGNGSGCGAEFAAMIDWKYDTFFSRAGSRPVSRKR